LARRVMIDLERVTKPLRDSQATPEARCAAVNLGLANHPEVAWVDRMEMPSAATSTDSRRATGERRTFEMKPTSQAWQAARKEPQSPPLIRSWNENLDSHPQIQPHGDLLRLQNPRVL